MTPGVPARRSATRGAASLLGALVGRSLRSPKLLDAPRGAELRGPELLAPAPRGAADLVGRSPRGPDERAGRSPRGAALRDAPREGADDVLGARAARGPFGAPFLAFFPSGFLSADLGILL